MTSFRCDAQKMIGQLTLSGELNLSRITSVKKSIQSAVRMVQEVRLKLDHATDVDFAFLQLLISAQKTAHKHKKNIFITTRHEPLVQLAQRVGISLDTFVMDDELPASED